MAGKGRGEPLAVDGNGRLQVPGYAARELARQPLELAGWSRHHLFFQAAGEAPVVLCGTLGDVTVADLLSFCNLFRKTGILTLESDCGRRDLFFQQGEIVFAQSSAPGEGLGEALLELGKLSAETLERARQMSGRIPIGKLLVDQKAVTAKDLWHATRHQVESIVYSLLGLPHGSFSFRLQAPEREGVVRLSMTTQNLIMEGLRRMDERQLFRRTIPSSDAVVRLTERSSADLAGGEQQVMTLVAGGVRPVRELVRRVGVGEFDGLRLIHRLVEKGLLAVAEADAQEPEGLLGELLSAGNRALCQLCRRILPHRPDFPVELRRYLRELPQPYSFLMRDVAVRQDGTLDGGGILSNLEGLAEGDKEKLLAEGLNEVIFMACQEVRRELGTEGSREVVELVQEIARRLMSMIGRSS